MYTIQANPSGTRSMEISEENLVTIEKYSLFQHLIDSNGIVDEAVLEKLKLNIRSLIASQEEDSKDLLDLCIDVIYHNNMKAFGLQQLIKLYLTWLSKQEAGSRRRGGSMITIDTCGMTNYSPLIPAIKAMCNASSGDKMEIVTDQVAAFQDLKEYLSEQGIGFREIYDGERMTLQFTIL